MNVARHREFLRAAEDDWVYSTDPAIQELGETVKQLNTGLRAM